MTLSSSKNLKEKLQGIIPVQLIPFTSDDEIDQEGLAENTQYLVDFAENGNKDVVILTNGSTSEFYSMSTEEQKTVIKTVVDNSGDVPVIAGTGRPGTKETIKMTQIATELGSDGSMVVLPYYHQATKQGMYQHYEMVAENVDIDIMIYNNPFVSGSWIDADLMKKLSKIENIIAVKENTSSGPQWYDLASKVEQENINLICGLGEKMYPLTVNIGAKGLVSTIANFAPDISYQMYEAGRDKDIEKVEDICERLNPYFEVMNKLIANRKDTSILPDTRRGNPVYQAMGKFALDFVGLTGGSVRSPMIGLTDDEKSMLEEALEEMEVKKV